MLPLCKEHTQNLLVVIVTPDDGQCETLCGLKKAFADYHIRAEIRRNIWTDELDQLSGQYDNIIFALCRTFHRPIGPLDFWGEEATSIWASNCSDKSKTMILNFGVPDLYKYYKKSGYTYVNTYACTPGTIRSVVKAIMGDLKFEGKSSVRF